MNFRSTFVGLVALAVAGCTCTAVFSQAPVPGANAATTFEPELGASIWAPGAGVRPPSNPSGCVCEKQLRRFATQREMKKRTAARKKLTELIDKYFDEDMVQRQKELAQLEQRLAKLREQLDRRRTKKQDIVDLQMKKSLLNEADGLGFFGGEPRRSRFRTAR